MFALNLKWEIAALIGAAVLIRGKAPLYSSIPTCIKLVHFTLVALYSVLGITGFRFLFLFVFKHKIFGEITSAPNILGLSPEMMQTLILGFSIMAIIFYFSAMELGQFRRWARQIFLYLVVPFSLLYPIIMATAFGLVAVLRWPTATVFATAAFLLVVSLFSFAFYTSRTVLGVVKFW